MHGGSADLLGHDPADAGPIDPMRAFQTPSKGDAGIARVPSHDEMRSGKVSPSAHRSGRSSPVTRALTVGSGTMHLQASSHGRC